MQSHDAFLPDTLFGTAFRQGDLNVFESIVEEIEALIPWRLYGHVVERCGRLDKPGAASKTT